MVAKILDGKKISSEVNRETAMEVALLARDHSIQPGLAVVLVGEDPASKVYVNMKVKRSKELGIFSKKIVLDQNTSQKELLSVVNELNNDKTIHGILVQSPPPPQINEETVVAAIDPRKDVDCFHPQNVGKMLIGDETGFLPCTPHGIIVLMRRSGVETSGRHAVIIGRSNIVGKPMAALLMRKTKGGNATVTVCHSRTPDISSFTKQADIVIVAAGKPEFLTAEMVKEGAVIIDVGINRVEAPETKKGYRLTGDVDFEGVFPKVSCITPVPGGVGPMTIAMLMHNAIKACKIQNGIQTT